mgnify:CR=1 FL=1
MLKHDFLWGGSVSSMQTEGAWDLDGRGPSIYDVRKIKANYSDWKVGIDFYHTYKEDIQLFKHLGLKAYRFSISWSRILPQGEGAVNEPGLAFYERVIDELIANGIEPMICVYHFDLPLALYETYGGWQSKQTLKAWKQLIDILVQRFSSKVKYWIPFNEQNVSYCGIDLISPELGPLSDEEKDKLSLEIWHNTNVAGAYLRQQLRFGNPKALSGGMINYSAIYPEDSNPKAVLNASLLSDGVNHASLEVMARGQYPNFITSAWKGIEPTILAGELELIQEYPVDFIGFSYYVSRVADSSRNQGVLPSQLSWFVERIITGEIEKNPYLESSEWGWTIDSTGLRLALKDIYYRYHLPVMIMESGIGVKEHLNEEKTIDDEYRIEYFRAHIQTLKDAVNYDGVECLGFLTWAPIDILSSKGEMKKRYGFIYANREEKDLLDLRRYKKASFAWFRKVIDSNGEIL